jgi:hypothetical protein
MKCHLVRDVLDMQLEDINRKRAGRVDGIIVELSDDGKPPKVVAIEVGPITLLARFSRRLAERYAKFDQRFGKERGRSYRVPWAKLIGRGPTIVFRDEIETTPINAVEDWLRVKIVERIPGS